MDDLYKLANQLNMNILIVYYPPYRSKYNPIEHRFFLAHPALAGGSFYNIQFVKELTEATSTSTGLSVSSFINKKEYQIKRPVVENFKTNFNNQITFDDKIPKWNYLIKPA